MKRLLMTLMLSLCVWVSAFAGEVPTVGFAPPPPPPSPNGAQASTSSVAGEIPTGGVSYEITDTAVDLIQMLLAGI